MLKPSDIKIRYSTGYRDSDRLFKAELTVGDTFIHEFISFRFARYNFDQREDESVQSFRQRVLEGRRQFYHNLLLLLDQAPV